MSDTSARTRKKPPRIAVPKDPWQAFAFLVGKCATGFCLELIEGGKSETAARNVVIGCFVAMAAGEACRIAREEGREPDIRKWRKATTDAFRAAVKRTDKAATEGGDR